MDSTAGGVDSRPGLWNTPPVTPRRAIAVARLGAVEDQEVLEAFVGGGAVKAFGPSLHVEGATLALDGWWKAAFRVAPTTFAVREEPPPDGSRALDGLEECLREHGLRPVGADPSLLIAVTYTSLDLGASEWAVWSDNQHTADAALSALAGVDTFFDDAPRTAPSTSSAAAASVYEAQRGGARRTAGLAAMVIVAVGLDEEAVDAMAATLDDCRIEARAISEIEPEECGSLLADLAFVDARSGAGMAFTLALRATPRGATMPIVALGPDGAWTPADVTVSPEESPEEWAGHIRRLLP